MSVGLASIDVYDYRLVLYPVHTYTAPSTIQSMDDPLHVSILRLGWVWRKPKRCLVAFAISNAYPLTPGDFSPGAITD